MTTRNYINLTNGLEWLPEVPDPHFLRIQSTHIEKDDWFALFTELDHDLLLHLALGVRCVVHDCGCRRSTSKVVSVGLPVIKYCLDTYWCGSDRREDSLADTVYVSLFEWSSGCDVERIKMIKRKYTYYQSLRFGMGTDIVLEGKSRATLDDGNHEYFRSILNRYLEEKT